LRAGNGEDAVDAGDVVEGAFHGGSVGVDDDDLAGAEAGDEEAVSGGVEAGVVEARGGTGQVEVGGRSQRQRARGGPLPPLEQP
jgi:hypothetical protein